MDSNQFRAAAHSAIDHIVEYYDTIENRQVMSTVEPGYLQQLLPDGPPEEGEDWPVIQNDVESKILPGLTHWQSPNFMAFFPSNSSFPGMLGELYSAAFNGAMFNWICGPAATELETIVLDWLATAFGLPSCFKSNTAGGGVIQGTASEAIVVVMIAARDRYLRDAVASISDAKEREDAFYSRRGRLVALGSDMAHSSTQKAALIAGVRFRSIAVSAANNYGMQGPEVAEALRQCYEEGLEPFYLTTTLGTTSTCAVDDFASIAEVTNQHPLLWVHVDAAYAGASLICPEYQHHAKEFGHFDSYDMNMHKWLLVNFDTSCLWVKNRRHLIDALSITPAYLRNQHSDSGLVTDYRDWQIPLGRRFRSLKIWFTLRTYGLRGLREHIRRHISYGEHFAGWIRSRPDLYRIFTPPLFALTVFQVLPEGETSARLEGEALRKTNELSQLVYEAVNAGGEIMITSSLVQDAYVIRVVSCSPKTEERHLRQAFEIITQTVERCRREQK